MVAQGAKVITLGRSAFTCDPAHVFLVSVGLPTTARVVATSPDRPYLALHLGLDPPLIAELLAEAGPAPVPGATTCAGLVIRVAELRGCSAYGADRDIESTSTPSRMRITSPSWLLPSAEPWRLH